MFLTETVLLLIIHFWWVKCQTPTIKQQNQIYEQSVKRSLDLERQDQIVVNLWTEQLQIKQVNVTSTYRLQMTKHRERCFRKNNIEEWKTCKIVYSEDIKKTEGTYYKGEALCLRISNSAYKDKGLSINQLENEIHKWRKSYRYLKRLCRSSETTDEEEIQSCLVQYMIRDNFSQTLQRLLQLKLEAMVVLHQSMVKTVIELEECLETQLSHFLEKVRSVMGLLKRCYEVKTGILS